MAESNDDYISRLSLIAFALAFVLGLLAILYS
jgi:hypothetical protein